MADEGTDAPARKQNKWRTFEAPRRWNSAYNQTGKWPVLWFDSTAAGSHPNVGRQSSVPGVAADLRGPTPGASAKLDPVILP